MIRERGGNTANPKFIFFVIQCVTVRMDVMKTVTEFLIIGDGVGGDGNNLAVLP